MRLRLPNLIDNNYQVWYNTAMNKITELKQAAGLYVDTSGRWANADGVDKLVELVVSECCNVLRAEDIRHAGYGYNQGFLHEKIKEHFGVKQ